MKICTTEKRGCTMEPLYISYGQFLVECGQFVFEYPKYKGREPELWAYNLYNYFDVENTGNEETLEILVNIKSAIRAKYTTWDGNPF